MREFALYHGDCLEQLKQLPDNFFDSMVTDPPAGIGFMNKGWDGSKGGRDQWIAWLSAAMTECLRVLKPGAHALVWAIPRTSHWTATALENAGFEVRDRVSHLFGTGFPKSLNIGGGRGTALKPAVEDWWLVRKPFDATVEKNASQYGTGVLNIDDCRIATDDKLGGGRLNGPTSMTSTCGGPEWDRPWMNDESKRSEYAARTAEKVSKAENIGRWPAHLVLSHSDTCGEQCSDDCAVRMLNEQSAPNMHSAGASRDGSTAKVSDNYNASSYELPPNLNMRRLGDNGGASRFFYCAKASTSERDDGLDHLPKRSASELVDRDANSAGINNPRAGAGRTSNGRANSHPTVKALNLMSWLIKLVTPPGGVVLDPFMGSGSTGVAAIRNNYDFIGIEYEEEYIKIAQGRIQHAFNQARGTEALPIT